MNEKKPNNTAGMTREEKRRRRLRQLMLRRTTVVVVALLLVAALVWGVIEIAKASQGQTTTFLGVKAIEVECAEGSVRYTDEEIIRASGVYIDQSLLALNKVQASERVLEQFPYLDFVEVKNSSFSTVCIRVAEAQVIAAVQHGEGWLIVGDNNHILEQVTMEAIPAGVLRVVGAEPLSGELRADALSDREWRILETLTQAISAAGATDMTTVDMTTKTDLRLWWKDRMEIVLGNESNLAAQVAAFQQLLPTLLEKNGDSVTGQLNMTTYADDNTDNDRAVFTPIDGLKPPLAWEPPTEEGTEPTGDTTAATTGSTTTPTEPLA